MKLETLLKRKEISVVLFNRLKNNHINNTIELKQCKNLDEILKQGSNSRLNHLLWAEIATLTDRKII